MSAIVTIRIDEQTKERATTILKRLDSTPSAAVQQLFEYVVANDALPFPKQQKPSADEVHSMIAAFDRCRLKQPANYTDQEIRGQRLKERYAPVS